MHLGMTPLICKYISKWSNTEEKALMALSMAIVGIKMSEVLATPFTSNAIKCH
jgi:hypothetical protein